MSGRRRVLMARLLTVVVLVGIAVGTTSVLTSTEDPKRVASVRARPQSTVTTTTTLPAPSTTLPPPPAQVPHVYQVQTADPVVFITIDDGWNDLPDVLLLLRSRQAPVTAFLIGPKAVRNANFYRQVLELGGTIEDHTMTHPDLARLSFDAQRTQFCQAADLIANTFGRRPLLARAPFGNTNIFTGNAIASCGMYADVHWSAEVARQHLVLAHPGGLQRGDIVLLHWGPGLVTDLQALFAAMDAAGLHAAPLQDYVGPTANRVPAAIAIR